MKRGIKDTEVFAALAAHPECCLVTKDRGFHRKPAEKEALMQHQIGAFVITSQKNKTGAELVELIRLAWSRMERFAQEHSRPFIAKVLADGHVKKAL
jgi:hypothetical protein